MLLMFMFHLCIGMMLLVFMFHLCIIRDDIEMKSNTAYGTVESQYEDVSVPDKSQNEPIYN